MASGSARLSRRSGSIRPNRRKPPGTRRQGRAIDHHRPVRSCIGCRQRRPIRELVRVTRAVDGSASTITVDGPSSGRGAWLCRDEPNCLDAAIRAKQFARAWRTKLTDDDTAAVRAAIGVETTDECDTPR